MKVFRQMKRKKHYGAIDGLREMAAVAIYYLKEKTGRGKYGYMVVGIGDDADLRRDYK